MSSITDIASNVDITLSQVAFVRLLSIRLQLIRLKLNSSVVLLIGRVICVDVLTCVPGW